MDPRYSLKVGDVVSVTFNNAKTMLCYEAEIIAIPCATGDSWVFKDLQTNFLHYVSEGVTVSKKVWPKMP